MIRCPEHGVFEQTPDKHLRGEYPCPKCNYNLRSIRTKGRPSNKKIKPSEPFLQKLKHKFKDVDFKLNGDWIGIGKSSVIVSCKEHGDTVTYTHNLLCKQRKYLCIKCSDMKRVENRTKTEDEVLILFSTLLLS